MSWKVDAPAKDDVEVWVRWSNDGGGTWHALTVGQRGSSVAVDPAQLPSGSVQFQILAHDGFHTVTAMTDPIQLPEKPPAVTILYPRGGSQRYGDRQIHLFGTSSSYGGGEIDPEGAVWYLDDKAVATGFDAWVDDPGDGPHEVRLEVTHQGLVGVATVRIGVTPEVG